MKVEEIRDDNDVLKFVKNNYKDLKSTDTSISFIPYPDLARDSNFYKNLDFQVYHFLDSLHSPHFIIDDFNKDGKKDLIVCLYINDDSKVLAFCSGKGNKYSNQLLSRPIDTGVPYFLNYKRNKKWLVIGQVNDWQTSFEPNQFSERFRYDTVAYESFQFTDYTYDESKRDMIDTIKYSFLGSRAHSYFSLIINRNQATLILPYTSNNDSSYYYQNEFIVSPTKDLLDTLFLTAQSLKLKSYKKFYSPMTLVHDGYSIKTQLVYKDGGKKSHPERHY